MPALENPAADTAEARKTLRGLAHATPRIDEPREIYAILGDLSAAAASLSQALHHLASVLDTQQRRAA